MRSERLSCVDHPRLTAGTKRIAAWSAALAVTMVIAAPATAQQCVAHWPLDGTPEELVNGDPGALVGGGVSFDPGGIGGFAEFDGASYVDAGANPALTDFADTQITISAWIRQRPDAINIPGNDPDSAFISARTNCNIGNWQAYNRLGSSLYFSKWWRDPADEFDSPEAQLFGPPIPDNVWRHVAISVSNNTASFYVDGVFQSDASDLNTPFTIKNAVQSVQLGWDSCGSYFTGDLDDVAVYSSALDANQVLGIYDDGVAGKAQCRLDPVTKADCQNGGWEDFGFKNQGQCIRFVNTGKDSR